MIHIAMINRSPELIKNLAERGIDLNAQNNDGDTALHYGTRLAHFDCVDILISLGACEKIINNMGQLPWDISYQRY